MGKIDIIEYCGDCSHRYYEGNDLHCDKTGDKVAENMLCPENCPLQDEAEATWLEKERCLKAVDEAKIKFLGLWPIKKETIDRISKQIKFEIKARIEAGE